MQTLVRYTLESPWPTAVLLAVVAAVLRAWGRRRADRRLLVAGPAVLALAGVVLALGYAIDTPRERVAWATRELVAACGPFDPAGFDALVAADAELLGPDRAAWAGLPAIRGRLERWAGSADTTHKVLGLTVDPPATDAAGRTTAAALLDLRTTGPATSGVPVFTTWDLAWERGSDGRWTARSFRWVRFNQQPPPRDLIP